MTGNQATMCGIIDYIKLLVEKQILLKGLDVDQPRNLAKSVTVE